MADVFTEEKRSKIMASIRSKNTEAEMLVFKYLRSKGIYFQKHYSRVAGKPDIALPRKRKAVFIDGDFWHGRHIDRVMKTRTPGDYWVKKLAGNLSRDARNRTLLSGCGWTILSVWESDIKRKRTRDESLSSIAKFLLGG